jgi:K+-sensing histidine kinase KdpD
VRTAHPDRWLWAGAVVVPLATAAALVPVRSRLVSTNIALILVITVVAFAASGRRGVAMVAACSAAVAFNFFATEPYYSLRIESRDDVETALLLLVVGLIVGELAVRGRRARSEVQRGREDLERVQGLGAMVATGEDPDYVLLATAAELTHLLALVDCRFEMEPTGDRILPVVDRDGSVRWGPTPWDTERWGLPTEGVTIPVWSRGRRQGRFVLTAPVGRPIEQAQLAKAFALADQAGASLAARGVA